MLLLPLLTGLCSLACATAVTVYSQRPLAPTQSNTASSANYTGAAAYDPTVLQPPPLPNPLPATTFLLQLQSSPASVFNLSIPQSGSFLGFSIEFSVINQVLGLNSSFLQVPFLNLMANLKERAGTVHIRVGGNTQETATLVPSLPGNKLLEKDYAGVSNPTDTPPLLYTPEVFYMMGNISSLVNAKWYLGVPLNDSTNLRLQIAEYGEAVLGQNLLGLQIGNEPDFYAAHLHRPSTYGPYDYFGEFGIVVNAIGNDTNIPVKNNLIGPSIAYGDWSPEQVWDTGFIPAYSSVLSALAVEHYPDDNCAAQFGLGSPKDPQTEFPNYLTHASGINIIAPFLASAELAQQSGKPFLMFETNTASCGGFPGVSDSFGSALWALDYGLQMAYSNFSGGLIHVGGQNVYYNPFTPPPTNQSTFHQWTVGPIFYASLIIAEAFGLSNTSQIVDLQANYNNYFTPAYAIYENGAPSKVALFNYMDDPSGANDYTATIAIGGGDSGTPNGTPSQISVKYLLAPSVSSLTNITWAGQTFGDHFDSDGRLTGSLNITTVPCDTTANTCQIKVPAPGFALVFLTTDDPSMEPDKVTAVQTYSTTAVTRTQNTATVDASVLATSNGSSGKNRALGSTSKGSTNGASGRGLGAMPGAVALVSVAAGAWIIARALAR